MIEMNKTIHTAKENTNLQAEVHQTARGVKNEDQAAYEVQLQNDDDQIINKALAILKSRMQKSGEVLNSPATVKNYLKLTLGNVEHEIFTCVFLNAQHAVIESIEMFRGTVTQCSVYPREVCKQALALNACAVIFAHNHPSGALSPSESDKMLTTALKQALALVDVRVLDHFIIAGTETMSFAERGLI
jgi:DNA repair protein RadC